MLVRYYNCHLCSFRSTEPRITRRHVEKEHKVEKAKVISGVQYSMSYKIPQTVIQNVNQDSDKKTVSSVKLPYSEKTISKTHSNPVLVNIQTQAKLDSIFKKVERISGQATASSRQHKVSDRSVLKKAFPSKLEGTTSSGLIKGINVVDRSIFNKVQIDKEGPGVAAVWQEHVKIRKIQKCNREPLSLKGMKPAAPDVNGLNVPYREVNGSFMERLFKCNFCDYSERKHIMGMKIHLQKHHKNVTFQGFGYTQTYVPKEENAHSEELRQSGTQGEDKIAHQAIKQQKTITNNKLQTKMIISQKKTIEVVDTDKQNLDKLQTDISSKSGVPRNANLVRDMKCNYCDHRANRTALIRSHVRKKHRKMHHFKMGLGYTVRYVERIDVETDETTEEYPRDNAALPDSEPQDNLDSSIVDDLVMKSEIIKEEPRDLFGEDPSPFLECHIKQEFFDIGNVKEEPLEDSVSSMEEDSVDTNDIEDFIMKSEIIKEEPQDIFRLDPKEFPECGRNIKTKLEHCKLSPGLVTPPTPGILSGLRDQSKLEDDEVLKDQMGTKQETLLKKKEKILEQTAATQCVSTRSTRGQCKRGKSQDQDQEDHVYVLGIQDHKAREPKTCLLWEFLLELLQKPKLYASTIKWVNREEGLFRIVDTKAVSRLWGLHKNKPNMTFASMSQGMRYYVQRGILTKMEGKLVYQFVDDPLREQIVDSDDD